MKRFLPVTLDLLEVEEESKRSRLRPTIGWLDLVFFQYLPKVKDGCERGRRWLPTTVPGLQAQVWMVAHRRGWSFVPTNYHPPASFPESRRLAHARLEPLLELSRQGRGPRPRQRQFKEKLFRA